MDLVITTNIAYILAKFGITIILFLYGVELYQGIRNAQRLRNISFAEALWLKQKYIIVFCFGLLSLALFIFAEPAYRQKNVIKSTKADRMKQEVKNRVMMPTPEVTIAEGDIRDNANKNYSEQNEEENREAINRFKQL